MKRQLSQLILVHYKEILREPAVLFWGILFPVLMAGGLGLAFTEKSELIRKIAVDSESLEANTVLSEFLSTKTSKPFNEKYEKKIYEFEVETENIGITRFQFIPTNWDSAIVFLKRGHMSMILTDEKEKVGFHFDPINPEAQLLQLQLNDIFNNNHLKTTKTSIAPLKLKGTRYIDFLIPGLIVMGIMMSCMWGISYGMIEKRRYKLLRRMVATPMKKSNFLISLFIARFSINFLEASALVLFAWLFFDVSIQGSLLAVLVIFLAGNIAFGGLAILVSSRTAKAEIGNGMINAVVMPMMVLSGIFFSYHNFPDWTVKIIQLLPLTMMADSMRSIFTEGAGLSQIALSSSLLTISGIIFFSIGIRVYKWY